MVKQSIDAKVRPLANASLEKASLLGAARLYVSKDSLISLTGNLENGKHCLVEKLDDEGEPLRREATLWALPEKNLSPNVVMMTRAFQEATGFKIGDQVRVKLAGTTPDAGEVVLQNLTEEGSKFEGERPPQDGVWEWIASYYLSHAEHIFPGMVFEGVTAAKIRRNFKVVSVDAQSANVARFTPSTSVRIISSDEDAALTSSRPTGDDLVITGVPGLPTQIDVLNQFLEGFSGPFGGKGELESCGFVIHGGHGTGKTFILERMAATNWGRVHWIRGMDKLTTIRETFKLARSQRRSMVLIDSLEDLIGKDRSNRESVIEAIGEELDSLSAEAIAAQSLPQVVVIATCSDYLTDVPTKLQRRSRLLDNIALPIPAAPERLEILNFLDPPIRADEKDSVLKSVAQKTHAYNGNDLAILVLNAWKVLRTRLRAEGIKRNDGTKHELTGHDFNLALKKTRASAMHDINLKPPTVHWQDVAGQEKLKTILSRMIKNTKNENPNMRRVLPRPPKGLLLYGPPGCSKTLCAQAMATESGFNFFAVKGAELLNMYVGESERAVRALFERARRAMPSIIFFDEIDSIGGQRAGAGASRGNGSVNMLTTLLTEMDGFETLSGVLILAATNRPEAMDPALLRPGRFDQVVYVGPPDLAAREAVFNVHLRNVAVAPDVDVPELARRSDGYSGAEIQAICTQAGIAAQERYDDDDAAAGGQQQQQEEEVEEALLEIRMADLTEAIERTPRNITPAMIQGYEKWLRQFKKAP